MGKKPACRRPTRTQEVAAAYLAIGYAPLQDEELDWGGMEKEFGEVREAVI